MTRDGFRKTIMDRLNVIDTTLAGVTSRVLVVENRLEPLQASVLEMGQAIATIVVDDQADDARVSDLARVMTNTAASQQAGMADLQAQVTQAHHDGDVAMAALAARLAAAQQVDEAAMAAMVAKIAAMQGVDEATAKALLALQQSDAAAAQTMATMLSTEQGLAARLALVEASGAGITTMAANVAAIQSAMAGLQVDVAALKAIRLFEAIGTTGADGTVTLPIAPPFTEILTVSCDTTEMGGRSTTCAVQTLSTSSVKIRAVKSRTFLPVLNVVIDPTEAAVGAKVYFLAIGK